MITSQLLFSSLLFLLHLDCEHHVVAVPLAKGLSDPATQPIFVVQAPNALDPTYIRKPTAKGSYIVTVGQSFQHKTGLMYKGKNQTTRIFAYGAPGLPAQWPGQTFVVKSNSAGGPVQIPVEYRNRLPLGIDHILPVDTTIHWAYSCDGYQNYTIKQNGVPISPHLHGGHTDQMFDGHPEAFWSPYEKIRGPFFNRTGNAFTNKFLYENTANVKATTLWYHDHALGMTRLNVYAGMVGFYFIRDQYDTGDSTNAYGLPYGPYELAYVIQDKMFTQFGKLFFPAYSGDPNYAGYLDDEGVTLPAEQFYDREGPTALAEFFGDHIVVNGKIWPKVNVEPTQYRIHLLNGCDSRFLVMQFMIVDSTGVIDPALGTATLDFTVIGGDQGLGSVKVFQNKPIILEVASRIDVIIDFSTVAGKRVILQNLWSDAPFGEDYTEVNAEDLYADRRTDRIMAFDVMTTTTNTNQFHPELLPGWSGIIPVDTVTQRQVALFEGRDEFGRIEPLLGSPTTDPNDPRGLYAVYTWSQPATEMPSYMSTEDWYIINYTEDAHAMHIHLTEFQVIGDFAFTYTTDGEQTVYQHMGKLGGKVPIITSISEFQHLDNTPHDNEYIDAPKDVVIVRPGNPEENIGRGTIIRMNFIREGIYEWHCHILSHEDHEMMREFVVVPKVQIFT